MDECFNFGFEVAFGPLAAFALGLLQILVFLAVVDLDELELELELLFVIVLALFLAFLAT